MREAGHPTVMVAHSDTDTRSMLRFWLEAEGYSVVEAADCQEAFELIRGRCPDLILISERMPTIGGFEATRRIRQIGNNCVFPIVGMSSYPTKEAHAAAINAGCDSFVPLPFDFKYLGDLLGRLLHRATAAASH